jgi:hypothetical protein
MPIIRKDVQYVREDRLHKEMSSLAWKRNRLVDQIKKERLDTVLAERLLSLETELCYMYRELEHRNARRGAHENYTQQKNMKRNHINRDNRAKPRQKVI